ncbi:M16 family metallopeptidase [Nonomuraea jiangxiensis]|uniref:Predicted Zn-dependent peptidase n=1 Tax=Nonomuraea jiangxiensis TaxID=633440 RepID=A0A1G9CQB7_9ACTN|nr:M16 family metallopeptidase [Nonomuraea jiangxiensis]SDK53880.1 Predicted Zn-dependent peptidase [Nonomuraea jiangxiensis]
MPTRPITLPEIGRSTLPNGLRLVLAPDPCAPTVGISLHYGVGFRSEPEGRTGFAHLFEHLMFEGSRNVAPGLHGRLVQAAGGTFNGSTGPDATNFYQTVPSSALERVLFLEADRLRGPRLTEGALAKQLAVVKDEIRRNVLSKPYGRFPWPLVSQTLYEGFADTHDGYGDFHDLDQATTADCADFFETYYHPANCVLAISGAIDPHLTTDLVARHFATIEPRHTTAPGPASARAEVGAGTAAEFRATHLDPHAPGPALAIGHRLPDPDADLDGYLAHMVLSALLTDGVTSRLQRALAAADLGAVTVRSNCGLMGGPLRARDPDTFTITAFHPQRGDADRVVATIDAELARLASPGIPHEELSGAAARAAAAWSRAHAQPGDRARAYGRLEILFAAANLADDLPGLLRQVTHEQISAAARRCQEQPRALVHVLPAPPATRATPSRTRTAAHTPARTRKAAHPSASTPMGTTTPVPVPPAAPTPAAAPGTPAPPGLPALGKLPPVRTPALADLLLGSGLRVVAVRSPAVPLVSVRLRIGLPPTADPGAAAVLGAMLLRESRCREAALLERTGWTIVPLADTGQLTLTGNGPAQGLGLVLRTLAGALATADGYDAADVRTTRTLIAHQIGALSAHPAGVARNALRRLRGLGPEYASAAAVSQVSPLGLEAFHATALSPAAASLVMVGDLVPEAAAQAAEALGDWGPVTAAPAHPMTPGEPAGPAWELIDHPGGSQVQVRFHAPCPDPGDPTFPAAEIANMAFGGYSSSRLSTALRDIHRYTYSARSVIEPERTGAGLSVSFDVRREAADEAVEEFHRVVHGVTADPYGPDEIDAARQYLIGRRLAGTGGQDDLAAAITGRIELGLPIEEIFGYGRRLSAVPDDDVLAVCRTVIVPRAFAGVAVGDFSKQGKQLVST